MTPELLLRYHDHARLWPQPVDSSVRFDVAAAYQQALAVRRLRLQRGEVPRGYKIGFTNRTIWPLYNVFGPIWGTVWESGLAFDEEQIRLSGTCQPRIEPEIVFGMRATPVPNATVEQLFDALDWLAPGFEVVQSHCLDWKFTAAETVADGALHARLLVGARVPVRVLAADAQGLHALLAESRVTLSRNGAPVAQGSGAHVLDSPLLALHHFLGELRQCPGATDVQPGDVVTTGTWTDAFPLQEGERWTAEFCASGSSELGRVSAVVV